MRGRMPKLVKLNTDYSDEFDVKCFAVIKDDSFDSWEAKLEAYDKEINFYFGTNECLDWCTGIDLLNEFSVEDITEAQADALKELFPASDNGLGIIAVFGTGCCVFALDEIFY